jgi:hypothetical protein
VAARSLGEIGPGAKEAIGALEATLPDPDLTVRVRAARALWRIDRRQGVALAALQAALKQQNTEAAHALGEMGRSARAAVPALEAAWKGRDRELAVAAAGALWRIGLHREQTMRALVEAVASEDMAVRWQAVEALEEMGPDARPALPTLRQALERAVGREGSALMKALTKIDPGGVRPDKGP